MVLVAEVGGCCLSGPTCCDIRQTRCFRTRVTNWASFQPNSGATVISNETTQMTMSMKKIRLGVLCWV